MLTPIATGRIVGRQGGNPARIVQCATATAQRVTPVYAFEGKTVQFQS